MSLIKIIFMCCLLCLKLADGKPFINPFNIAFQKTSDENGGHTLSLVYPKKSTEFTISFGSRELNQHKFDFGAVLQKFTKIFSKFNFFLQSTPTTEAPTNENSSEKETGPEDGSEEESSEITDENYGSSSEAPGSSSTGFR